MKTVVIFDKGIEGRECRFDENNFKQGNNFGPGTIVLGLDGKVYENYGTEEKPFWEEVFDAEYEVSPQDIPAIDITTSQKGKSVWKELYDRYKETEGYKIDKEIGDVDYMYKWIREKSGK
jgi:hypothetical protein